MSEHKVNENQEPADKDIWQDYDRSGEIRKKAELLKSWIPEGVKTIADIGCGNGIISNLLGQDYDVTAVDISDAALSYVTTKKVKASALNLPFEDASFDLVLSSEMLEHLSTPDLHQAIRELKRVSKRWLIISVPHREQLAGSDVKCASCAHVFNANGHLQSFTFRRLQNLFSKYQIRQHLVFGPVTRDYEPNLLKLRQAYAKQWFNPDFDCVCPQCGSREFLIKTSLLSKACNFLSRLFTRKRLYWIMLLAEKKIDN